MTLSSSARASAACPVGSVCLLPRSEGKRLRGGKEKKEKTPTKANTPLTKGRQERHWMDQERNGSVPNLPSTEGRSRVKRKNSPELRNKGAYEGS